LAPFCIRRRSFFYEKYVWLSNRQARAEGYSAEMLPGISAEDCLFADLRIDPGKHGCQSFEATDFLIRNRRFDPYSSLILWQIAMVGNLGFYEENNHNEGLTILSEVLQESYTTEHEVIVYEAAIYPTFDPIIQRLPLQKLPQANIHEVSALYMPPKTPAPLDKAMMKRLNMQF